MKIFSMYDSAAEFYNRPFFEQTTASAIRAFSIGVKEEGTPMNLHPTDFSLWHIGDFDDQKGEVIPVVPNCISKAIEFIRDGDRGFALTKEGQADLDENLKPHH